jgi:uncharacterized metal-binding protein YceD (DUF177 family)
MKHSREFEIAFVGLKPGEHEFRYRVDSRFFERFGKTEFHDADVEVKLTLDKKSGIFLLHFDISGRVILPCDRCGDDFPLTLWDEFDLVVKVIDDELVEAKSLEDAEVAYIGRSESLLDVAPWIYEFIVLSVPMQHIHPNDADGKPTCNPEALKFLLSQQAPEHDNEN